MQLDTRAAVQVLNAATSLRPNLGIVLGSAFGQVAESIDVDATVGFADLPGCVASTVEGHAGQFIIGRLGSADIVVQAGRLHYYEGYTMDQVTFPIRVMAAFGVEQLLLTNAAGGIAADLKVGDFMRITDHINLMGSNPLRGKAVEGLPVFVDMCRAYSELLGQALGQAAAECGVELKSGVFAAVSGPSYETPAEIRSFSTQGADAVAMSTVPETIVARQIGLEVAGLSCITNAAAGLSDSVMNHGEVLSQSRQTSNTATSLLTRFCELTCKS